MLKFITLFLLISCATVSHKLGEENRQYESILSELEEQEKILNNGFNAFLIKEIYPQDYLRYENCDLNSNAKICEKLYWELNYKYWFYITKFVKHEQIEEACAKDEETKNVCRSNQSKTTLLLSLERNYIEEQITHLNKTISQNKVLIAEDESRARFTQVAAVVATLGAIAIISSQNQGGNSSSGHYYGGGAYSCLSTDVWVNGYFRRDGTFVKGHCRSKANGLCYDNYSSVGNINPNTGQNGYKDCDY